MGKANDAELDRLKRQIEEMNRRSLARDAELRDLHKEYDQVVNKWHQACEERGMLIRALANVSSVVGVEHE